MKYPSSITVREKAVPILRAAREWVRAGIIRKGRTNIKDMLLDALEDAKGYRYKTPLERSPAVMSRVQAYLCLCLPRRSDPGSRRQRVRYLAKWSCLQYVTQDRIIDLLDRAVTLAETDVRDRKRLHQEKMEK